jgi:trimeric autotransporter adhesin
MKNQNVTFTTILLALACFGLLPQVQAVVPSPDGCYPGYTTAEGCNALNFLTTGAGNTGVGWYSLYVNTTGNFNTGVGGGALALNNGDSNTAVGAAALLLNSTGSENTAVGTDALVNNTADANTATGFFALGANTTGGTLETVAGIYDVGPNTAIGSHALESNVDGSANTAVGHNALHSQVHGDVRDGFPQLAGNTAVGFEALANVTGSAAGDNAFNTADGYQALADLTDGFANVAVGALAGTGLITGDANISVGYQAGIGNVTGSGNIFIGYLQGPATAAEVGHTYIHNINLTNVSGGGTDTVTINLTTGLLGHLTSSRRYKEDINPMDKASEALFRLKPVTFRYKKEIDKTQSVAFGLIAEQVAEVNPDLVAHNAQGQPESVHYEMVNAMLLNEFLREHQTVQKLQCALAKQEAAIAQQAKDFQSKLAEQQKEMETVVARLKEHDLKIQRVNDQLELSKPAPRIAAGDR